MLILGKISRWLGNFCSFFERPRLGHLEFSKFQRGVKNGQKMDHFWR